MSEQKLSRRQQAELYLQDPNVKRYLDLISYAEGTQNHGYYTKFGGGRIDDLSRHPNINWARTGDGPTSATGRYQITKTTWNEQAKKLGLTNFSPESQDIAAVSLIMQRGAINDILNGDIDSANRKLSNEWASLPYNKGKHQSQKSSDSLAQVWAKLGGKDYAISKYQYDHSTTPLQHTAENTPLSELPQIATIDNPFADFQQSVETVNQPQVTTAQTLNSWNNEIDVEPMQDYQAQLAKAFGVPPKGANNGLGDYVGSLVASIYDQTG